MLLSCIAHLRRKDLEWRNVRLYGQERNLMTSSIARMNCFLHGIEDFQIVRGDTLSDPKFVEGDRLKRFDLVLANPPYSIKQWDRDSFASDPWGRNLFGTPPQGRADYAFWQHIICSLTPETGRCAILFPHGVLFRQEESEMRQKLIEADLIECVLGLGPNLFYNSPMEACVVICRSNKPKLRKNKILFINAVNEIIRERAQSLLTGDHITRISNTYQKFHEDPGFSQVATLAEVGSRSYSLAIPLYVDVTLANGKRAPVGTSSVPEELTAYLRRRRELKTAIATVLPNREAPRDGDDLAAAACCALLSHRRGWRRVRFGDVVENVNETAAEPKSVGLDRFIGLEHLEPGSLHVRAWGNLADGTTFTRRCRPGQLLFGKRRAYQRKVAVAEFDAVVSGDIYVLRPRDNRLLSDFLPFVCLSEQFFRHAVGTSAGSLSPRTNWGSLASFEFDLPPPEQQHRIAELMWSIDNLLEACNALVQKVQTYREVVAETEFSGPEAQSKTLSSLCGQDGIRIGPFGSQLHTYDYVECGVPVVMPINLNTDRIITIGIKQISRGKAEELAPHQLEVGDVLLPRRGDLSKIGFVHPGEEGWICGTGTVRVRLPENAHRRLLYYALSRKSVADWLNQNAVGTTMPNLNASIVGRLRISWPADPERAADRIMQAEQVVEAVAAHRSAIISLQGYLMRHSLYGME